MVFDRRVKGETLTFGVSGLLRDSNLIMWDHETESWWQQGTFQAIVGEHAGQTLSFIPSHTASWSDFRNSYPKATVLSGATGSRRQYGFNPYENYDTTRPFLFEGQVDDRVPALHRVVGLTLGGKPMAYPFKALRQEPVLYQALGGQELLFFYDEDTTSPADQPLFRESRPVGSVGVFLPLVDGERLSFRKVGKLFADEETGSTWNVLGKAIAGEMEGRSLSPVFHTQPFWFYWQSAHPDTEVYRPEVFLQPP